MESSTLSNKNLGSSLSNGSGPRMKIEGRNHTVDVETYLSLHWALMSVWKISFGATEKSGKLKQTQLTLIILAHLTHSYHLG